MLITVTGATGHLGRRIVHQLSKTLSPNQIRVGAHTPSRSSPKCWCKLNSANLSFHKLKHTGFF